MRLSPGVAVLSSASVLLALFAVAFAGVLPDNYYERLDVSDTATKREIRVAFRKKAMEYHPDKNPNDDDAHTRMTEINEAYDVLSDEDKRNTYDALGKEGLSGNGGTRQGFQGFNFYETFGLFDADLQIQVMDYHSWEASKSSTEAWAVMLFSPRSDLSVELTDTWRELGTELLDIVNVAVVNCDTAWPVCRAIGVRALPTIVMYTQGNTPRENKTPITFTGESKTVNTLHGWVMDALQTEVQPLLPENFNRGMAIPYGGQKGRRWLVGYCDDSEGCLELDETLKEISIILGTFIPAGRVNCKVFAEACKDIPDTDNVVHFYDLDSNQPEKTWDEDTPSREVAMMAISTLPALPVLTTKEMERIADVALHPVESERLSKASHDDEPLEYLILFTNQEKCNWETPEMGIGSSECWKAQLTLRRVLAALQEPNSGKMVAGYEQLRVFTFTCHAEDQVMDDRVMRLCKGLGVGHGRPELILLKDGGFRPQLFHDRIDRPNQVLAFVLEDYKSIIHEVTKEDFDTHVINEGQTWFIDFYAPWCHHCRNVYPEWNVASKSNDLPIDPKVHFAKINCDQHHDFCSEWHISGYPTFLLFNDGVRHQFDLDHRTAEEFVRFVKEALEPVVEEFNEATFKRLVYDPDGDIKDTAGKSPEMWIVDFFAPWCSHCKTMNPMYRAAAASLRGVMRFGKMNCELDAAFCKKLAVSSYPTIHRYSAYPSERATPAVFDGHPDAKEILEFAMAKVTDFMIPLQSSDLKAIVKNFKTKPLESWVVFFYSEKDCPTCLNYEMKVKALASRYVARKENIRTSVTQQDPVEAMKTVEIKFAKLNCRASGMEYTACLKMRVKKFPTLVYYSGARDGETTVIGASEPLEIISAIDKLMDQDRRTLEDPFQEKEKPHFHFHDEL